MTIQIYSAVKLKQGTVGEYEDKYYEVKSCLDNSFFHGEDEEGYTLVLAEYKGDIAEYLQ